MLALSSRNSLSASFTSAVSAAVRSSFVCLRNTFSCSVVAILWRSRLSGDRPTAQERTTRQPGWSRLSCPLSFPLTLTLAAVVLHQRWPHRFQGALEARPCRRDSPGVKEAQWASETDGSRRCDVIMQADFLLRLGMQSPLDTSGEVSVRVTSTSSAKLGALQGNNKPNLKPKPSKRATLTRPNSGK